jgi:UDP-N-acetylglucosamine 2-epimerase (non-hydrolysing)
LTDSGGIQEEACILRIPCVTLRENTERPETVRVGANVLCAPQEAHLLAKKITDMRSRSPDWENPFGDGATAKRVVDILVASGKV